MALAATHDIAVVGAGPAGATAARVAAARGLRVALLDKAAFPRDKLCGGALSHRALSHIGAVFGDLPGTLLHPCPRVVFAKGTEAFAHDDNPPLMMTMRHGLDAHLKAGAVAAGAEDVTGSRLVEVALGDGTLVMADGRMIRARVIIGADGVKSQVARTLFGKNAELPHLGFALEAEVDGPPGQEMVLDLCALPSGYGWDFPKAHGRTLGIGGRMDRQGDMMAVFRSWLSQRGVDPVTTRIRGHHLPFGACRAQPGRDHVLLAGDAAGFVDPITGEGIAWAVKSGQLAAEAAALALAMGAPERAFALYAERVRRIAGEIRRAGRLSMLAYHPFWQQRFLGTMASSAHLRRRYLDLLAGELDYADLGALRLMRLAGRLLLPFG